MDRPSRSTATQVTYWLMLVSLVVAVVLMGLWWTLAGILATSSTIVIFLLATAGVWIAVYRLLVYGIKRLVRSRLA